MDSPRKICVVTGSRAEYGLLYWLLREIDAAKDLELQLIVTGMHLSPEFGFTCRQIEQDGFVVSSKVEMLLSSDSPAGVTKSIGIAVMGFADLFDRIKPDLLLVLGDRFEIFSAASAAMIFRIPIGHIHGGEVTEGAFDEAIRHSITKMAHLHFTATELYRKRVIQMGEQPERVFNVGALGLDSLRGLDFLTKEELERDIGFKFGKHNLMVTFHPVTLEDSSGEEQFRELLRVLKNLDDTHILFTKANADTGGRMINRMIDEYVEKNRGTAIAFTSLGQRRYLSAMRLVDGVVGNSSSGILEAPGFKVGTVNIGDRQKGRIKAESVIDCLPDEESIRVAIHKLLYDEKFRRTLKNVSNPYGEGGASKKIVEIVRNYPLEDIVKKRFFDIRLSL